ncbi:hypothetical protein ACFLU3_05870, partial [Chloroflexota bacterium]
MRNVFILGAGASRRAGGPLMADFLESAAQLLRQRVEGVTNAQQSFDDVFNAIVELQTVHAKSYLDLDNIEILFGAIEMAQVVGKLGKRSEDEISTLRKSIVTLIFTTLEYSIKFTVRKGQVYPPDPYQQFVDMLKNKVENRSPFDPHSYSILTFNYDMALDFALYNSMIPFDY